MKNNRAGKRSQLNPKIISTSLTARPELSQRMKRVVEDSLIAKAEAHTAAFKMIKLNPATQP